jgi:branched-chain amino acid transport system permease protein
MMQMMRREALLWVGLVAMLAMIQAWLGSAYTLRMLVEASCYALIALGLGIQWGYGGLFNAGILGFVALGAFATMQFSYPVNAAFWDSEGPAARAYAASPHRLPETAANPGGGGVGCRRLPHGNHGFGAGGARH